MLTERDAAIIPLRELPSLTDVDRRAKLSVLRMAEDQILGAVKIRMRIRGELGMAEDRLTTAEVMRMLTGGGETTIDIGPLKLFHTAMLPTPQGAQPCGCDPSHRIDGVIKGYINPDCPTHAVPRDAPTLPPLFDIPFGTPPTRTRAGDQPLPTVNAHPYIADLVKADVDARRTIGISRYGTALQPFNGRDGLRDLYEELLDAAKYARLILYERDGK